MDSAQSENVQILDRYRFLGSNREKMPERDDDYAGLNASAASARVGYESAWQFSAEFKRLFGLSSADEVKRLGTMFHPPASRAAPAVAKYVTAV